MKKTLLTLPLLALCLTSCDEITDVVSSVRVPAEATPSKDFTYPELPAEEYAAEAHRFVTGSSSAPFTSIEFFGDGHYIMSGGTASRANVADAFGTYLVDGSLHYTLDNGDVVDASNLTGASGTVTYTTKDGDAVSVSITSDTPLASLASKAFCRTWSIETSKYWLSVKGLMALHRDYYMENGELKHKDNPVANFIGNFYDGDLITKDRWPETITISPFGTYFVKFASGKTLLQEWSWADEGKGKIKTASGDDFNLMDFLKKHEFDIRFVDNKLVLYTEYDIQSTSINNANTFAPKTR